MVDYDRMNKAYPKQKAALTRAINSGDPRKVIEACRKAVQEWGEIGAWPDGWARWNIALQDANFALAREGVPISPNSMAFSLEDL